MTAIRSDDATGMLLAAPATRYAGLLVAAPLVTLLAYSLWTQAYVDIDRTATLASGVRKAADAEVRNA